MYQIRIDVAGLGNRQFTLLDAHLQVGRRFTVEKIDGGSNGLIIAPSGTTKINGANASVRNTNPYARAEIICGFEAGTSTPCWFVKFATDNTRPTLGSNALATLASGVATITSSYSRIDTEASAATDDCDTITYPGVTDGTIIVVRSVSSARDVTFKDGTGNLTLAGDFLCNSAADRLMLIWEGSAWAELSRSANT